MTYIVVGQMSDVVCHEELADSDIASAVAHGATVLKVEARTPFGSTFASVAVSLVDESGDETPVREVS